MAMDERDASQEQEGATHATITRRGLLISAAGVMASTGFSLAAMAARAEPGRNSAPRANHEGTNTMNTITTKDGTQIFFKDWGPRKGQPIVFHHGWPLTGDDWDTQMLYFAVNGFRVIAHDRRGHGRSSQVAVGHDMDHYAADVAAVVEHLDLRNAVHIGHSTGGGEAARYVARHGQKQGRVAKLVMIGAVPPLMLKTAATPGGVPIEVLDGLRKELAANRAQFYLDFASGPFYGYNRPGAKVHQGVIQNWWRQGMMGGANAISWVSRPSPRRTSRKT